MIKSQQDNGIIKQCSKIWEQEQNDGQQWYKHPIIMILFNTIIKMMILVVLTIVFRAIIYPLFISPILIAIGIGLRMVGLS
jgi:hypothetical protein